MRLALVALATLFISTVAFSATIYVPDNYATIQGAIDASSNGDVVIVRPGTYVENIDFVGKAITVKSEQGASVTIIDGNEAGSVVIFDTEEGRDSVLEGFTITNGLAVYPPNGHGGGIYCGQNSSPTIIGNIICSNIADDEGGGIYCDYSSPLVKDNLIIQNHGFLGGGIYCKNTSYPAFVENIISDNVSYFFGGGLHFDDCSPVIIDNFISGNIVSYAHGGGLFFVSSSGTLFGNLITQNTAADSGGAIYCEWSSSLTLVNNTICNNSAPNTGGGIRLYTYCDMTMSNTVLWNNNSNSGSEIYIGFFNAPSTVSLEYCCIEGGQSSCFVEQNCTLNWGAGMIETNPLFVDSTNDDFHLTWNSPCRDTGDNSAVTELYDFEGDPRIALGTVDMGADEYYYHLYHMGDVIPGFPIDIKVVGYPTAPITLYLGSGLADPPYSTQHGDFFLNWPPLWQGSIGTVPGNGVLTISPTVPTTWTPGSEHPFQAFVGPWNGPWTLLTNAEVLVVE